MRSKTIVDVKGDRCDSFNNVFQEITEERTLLQFHYTEWHSHTCPFGNAVLEFRRRVRAVVGSTIKNESGPMVVHCK